MLTFPCQHSFQLTGPQQREPPLRKENRAAEYPILFLPVYYFFHGQGTPQYKQRNKLHTHPYLIEEILYKVCYSHVI